MRDMRIAVCEICRTADSGALLFDIAGAEGLELADQQIGEPARCAGKKRQIARHAASA